MALRHLLLHLGGPYQSEVWHHGERPFGGGIVPACDGEDEWNLVPPRFLQTFQVGGNHVGKHHCIGLHFLEQTCKICIMAKALHKANDAL